MSAKVPGNESSQDMGRKGQGAKVPGSKLARVLLADSLRGANWPGSEKAVNLYHNRPKNPLVDGWDLRIRGPARKAAHGKEEEGNMTKRG